MYKLISFDMDGTLLTSQLTITEPVCEAVSRAAARGKTIILCTGRSVSELQDYLPQLPDVRYSVCVSGSLVYDFKGNTPLFTHAINESTVMKLMDIAAEEDVMMQFLGERIILEKKQCADASRYHMQKYQAMYEKIAVLVDDIRSFYCSNPFPVCKMNLYHISTEARERTRRRLLNADFPVTMKDSEETSLELTACGVTKALGLAELCAYLHIPLTEVIAVGDADNDLDVLEACGLPLAMGNAWPSVKTKVLQLGGAVLSDNDHDGCREAIEKYLL